ncbi:Dual-specificity kinase [Purpureocillium takamizusanense]|uniref:Dual-specificity kinase n=1 Tax=Purpureocillium takamizusanense TaxID=2060973 RepID=A0A9Q8V7N7_9HYPO|nr:Dual-specificity kinase [Purpureocillium takamizusanense]UNI14987.1 Dual-specificity kinase [Purpureocillium takamizusanense]
MATASPTPMATAGPVRRISQRQALRRPPSRPMLNRSESQPAPEGPSQSQPQHHGQQSQQHQEQQQQQYNHHHHQHNHHHDDSSEDEIPVPMKLSALTKALLNDGVPEAAALAATRPPSPPRTRRRASQLNTSAAAAASSTAAPNDRRHLRSGSVQAADPARSSKPPSREASPVRKRVVRLSNTPQSLNQIQPSKRRSTSMSRSTGAAAVRPAAPPARPPSRTGGGARERSAAPEERPESRQEEQRSGVNTPARGERVVRIVTGSSGNRSRIGSAGPSSGRSNNHDRSAVDRSALEGPEVEQPPEAPETVARNSANSSMRVKRVGKIPGSFLSGPARRGRRRQSEEDVDENGDLIASQEPEHQAEASYYADGVRDFNSGSPISGNAAARAIHRRYASNANLQEPASARPSPRGLPLPPKRTDEIPEHMLPMRIEMPSAHDQENEVPASYKRSKISVDHPLEKNSRPLSVDINLGVLKAAASPPRKPLAAITNNTPHRPAPPPPPKMSVLEAATSTAGAAATTTQAKQRRNVLRVNGKCYTRLDCLGRGGSAKVYRVTAENGNMFALKRVSLENADETTIKGYKGEIDLLGKLSSVDRVIKLFDHEMNSEKQVLTLLMEMGELDLNKLLASRQNPEAAKFDPVFVRCYWKEMLECVQSVHQYDIVHSDLKPANFVLVRGRLKLIDFGIANAIQTDETVNVHRETQIGTPSYMSPESLMDSNNPRGGRLPGRPKLMKLGKPSDIWSLGCILYQMVYGLPPFGHIANPMARCQAIVNWDHHIDFPSRAMGGVPVPPSLMRTMRRCLNREIHMRPTCEELLHETDPFLYPAELTDKALPIDEELLGRIIQSVVTRCRERMPTEAETMSVWPQAYWASIRKAMASRH